MSLETDLMRIAAKRLAPSSHMNAALIRDAKRVSIYEYMVSRQSHLITHDDLVTAITFLTDPENQK